MSKYKPYILFILGLAFLKFILPFVLSSPVYELHRDEYLYYQQGQHAALGYLENPPLLSWLAKVSSWLGGSFFWIRFWPSMAGALTLVSACLITIELGGRKFAVLITGLGVITGVYLRINALFQPNSLDFLFCTISLLLLIKYLEHERDGYIYALAVTLALGFLSKYSTLFLAAAIVISLLLTSYRSVFLKKSSYIALLLFMLLVIPNVIWQYLHHWPLVHHMRELQETQLRYLQPADFIKDQLLMLLPVLIVWAGGLVWLLKSNKYRYLAFIFLFTVLIILFGRGKSYYTLGVYPMMIAAGAMAWEKWTSRLNWLRYAMVLFIIGTAYLFVPVLLPTKKPEKLAAFYEKKGLGKLGILKWEDLQEHPLPQDFADMLGWNELSERAEKFYNTLPDPVKKTTVIYCRNYGQAGALRYYGRSAAFRNRVISDNGSFLLWIPDTLSFQHLILIGRQKPGPDDPVFQHFETVTIIDSVRNPLSRQNGDKVIFFQNADAEALPLAREGLRELKKEFGQ